MLNKKPILDTHRAHNLQFILVLVLAVAVFAIGYFLIFINNADTSNTTSSDIVTEAPTTRGVAFDWKKSEVLNNFLAVSFMPEGWDYITVKPSDTNGLSSDWGFWAQTTDPSIASRDLETGMTGDDIMALKSAMNNLQPVETTDEFYFEKLTVDGNFDDKTSEVVKKLQKYLFLDATGVADMNFQYRIYKQLVEPPLI
jgi:hypothetical protein